MLYQLALSGPGDEDTTPTTSLSPSATGVSVPNGGLGGTKAAWTNLSKTGEICVVTFLIIFGLGFCGLAITVCCLCHKNKALKRQLGY